MDNQSLYTILYTFLDWHPARIKTFAELILGIIRSRTVRIKELALYIESSGTLKARIKKISRLMLHQAISVTIFGKIIVRLLTITGKVRIAIDRTNWQFGANDLNFFVAAVIYGNISIPISWIMLKKKGSSNIDERKNLIEEILDIISQDKIEIIVADREFIGEEWLDYLYSLKLPFAIRVKKNELMKHKNGGWVQLCKFFTDMNTGTSKTIEAPFYHTSLSLKITCLQLEREQLFIVSNTIIGTEALLAYKQRWSIERSFKSLKTSGFNIEDTHITDLKKLEKLFAICSIALAICVVAGEIKNAILPIKIKNHGRKLYSLFTYGFDWLKNYFITPLSQELQRLFAILHNKIMNAAL